MLYSSPSKELVFFVIVHCKLCTSISNFPFSTLFSFHSPSSCHVLSTLLAIDINSDEWCGKRERRDRLMETIFTWVFSLLISVSEQPLSPLTYKNMKDHIIFLPFVCWPREDHILLFLCHLQNIYAYNIASTIILSPHLAYGSDLSFLPLSYINRAK